MLNGESESIQPSEVLSPNELTFFKYKNLLTDKRRSMVFENIAKNFVIQCNLNLGK